MDTEMFDTKFSVTNITKDYIELSNTHETC